MFTDTHCHIHEHSYPDRELVYQRASSAGVDRLICVGTDIQTSQEAVDFARRHDGVWAVIGIHPHEAGVEKDKLGRLQEMLENPLNRPKIVAIGEIGLDYFYRHSPREVQIEVFERQIELAQSYHLPVVFHVREAFDDFWPIFDRYEGVRGVLHSYTDNLPNLAKALSCGLYIGVNGISTFAKDKSEVYRAIPLKNMLLETDSPFLTPVPYRGKVNEPAFITQVAQYIANLQSINLEELSRATQRNATNLFLNQHQ